MNEEAPFDPQRIKRWPSPQDLAFFYRLYPLLQQGMTLAQAAAALEMDKGQVSRTLRQLEKMLWPDKEAGSLAVRISGQSTRTTVEGDLFWSRVRELLQLYAETVSPPAPHRELRLAATNAVTSFILPEALKRFLPTSPSLNLTLHEGEWWEVLRLLRAGAVDVGLAPAVAVGADLVVKRVLESARGLCFPLTQKRFAAWRSTDKGKEQFKLTSLAGETLVLLPSGVDPGFGPDSLPPSSGRRIIVRHYAEVKAFVRAGLGVGILHDHFLTPEDERVLGWIDLGQQLGKGELGVYCPADQEGSIAAVADALVAAIDAATRAARDRWRRT